MYGIFVTSVYKMNGKLWGDDIINSLICIFILTSQEMFFWKFVKLQSVIKFSLFCSKIYTFTSEIKFNLFWISPLNVYVKVSV